MPTATQTIWLTEEEQATWRSFNVVGRLIEESLDRQLTRDADMGHAHYAVLVALSEAEGARARMGDLAQFLQFSPSRLSHAVRRMERDGWITREACPTDGRGQEAVLTSTGRAAIERAAQGHVAEVRRLVFDALTDDQQRQLREISHALLASMRYDH